MYCLRRTVTSLPSLSVCIYDSSVPAAVNYHWDSSSASERSCFGGCFILCMYFFIPKLVWAGLSSPVPNGEANQHPGTSFQAERLRQRRHIYILGRMVKGRHGGILSVRVGHRTKTGCENNHNSCFMRKNLAILSRQRRAPMSSEGRRTTPRRPRHLSQKLPRTTVLYGGLTDEE